MDPNINVVFGDTYKILDKIGQGNSGTDYRALNVVQGKNFVLKVLTPKLRYTSTDQVQSLEMRAKELSSLKHSGINALIEFGIKPRPFVGMEFAEGKPLSELLAQEGPLPATQIRRLVSALSEALSYAHDQNMVHLNLKPENIMVQSSPDGQLEVKILDFGIAKMVEDHLPPAEIDEDESPGLGTPDYMSPEQFTRDQPLGPPTDIYALGCIIFYCLTGRKPFQAKDYSGYLSKHVHAAPGMDVNTQSLSKPLKTMFAISMKCLSKSPSQRPRADEINKAVNEIVIKKGPDRKVLVAGIAAASIVLLLGIGAIVVNMSKHGAESRVATALARQHFSSRRDAREELEALAKKGSTDYKISKETLKVKAKKGGKPAQIELQIPECSLRGCLLVAATDRSSEKMMDELFDKCLKTGLIVATVHLDDAEEASIADCLKALKARNEKTGNSGLKTAVAAVQLDLDRTVRSGLSEAMKADQIDALLAIDPIETTTFSLDPSALQKFQCPGLFIVDAHLEAEHKQKAIDDCEKMFLYSGKKQMLFTSSRLSLLGSSEADKLDRSLVCDLISCFLNSSLQENKTLESFLFSQKGVLALSSAGEMKYR